MNRSESIANIIPALMRAQAQFPPIVKTKKAEIKGEKANYSFMYAPLEEIVHKIKPCLQAEGLLLMQGVDGDCLVTTLWHQSGEWIACSMKLPAVYATLRAYGSELSYRRRYQVAMFFDLVAEDDDDGMVSESDSRKKRSPLTEMKQEAFDSLPDEEQEYLRKLAADVSALLQEEREAEAHGILEHQNLDMEEKLAIWLLFNSKERAALKRAQGQAIFQKKMEERAAKENVTPIRGPKDVA